MSDAGHICELLAVRHRDDVFATEVCVNTGHMRMDAWAMKKAWANPAIHGYEVKISRADFMQDDKWPLYLEACNYLWFVCPWGLIAPEETPEGCGLIWESKTGTRLFNKRKAPRREIEEPVHVLKSLLFNRAIITRDRFRLEPDREFWESWLAEKDEKKRFGHGLRRRLSVAINDRLAKVDEIELELAQLRKRTDKLAEADATLKDLGVRLNGYQAVGSQIREALDRKDGELGRSVSHAIAALTGLKSVIDDVKLPS